MRKTNKIILISLFISLSIILDYVKSYLPFLNMPQGGSINIALIPIVLSSFYLGYKDGLITGLMWWLISSILGLNNNVLNIYQYILDYIIPSFILGLSSIFYHHKNYFEMILGIVIMMFIRTFSIVISGALFWLGDGVNITKEALIASLAYNLPYSIVTSIMLIIVCPIIYSRIKRNVV